MCDKTEIDVLKAAQRRIDALRRENERLRAEGRALRRRVAPGPCYRIVTRAHADAVIIMHYRHAGLAPGRRWLRDAGVMSERQYGWAIALLRMARLDRITPVSLEHLDTCLRRLQLTAERLLQDDDLTALRVRANKNIALKR